MAHDWVSCDACGKWRRIPQEMALALDDDAVWYCKDNPDTNFNSCEHAQEFSDQEIDEMIQQAAGGVEQHVVHEDGEKGYVRGKKRPAVWQLVSSNLYPHRSRNTQDDDEIMVCQCSSAVGTDEVACGEHCLNRMLNIECVEKFCPNGSRCTNRQFSQRKYASLEIQRAGKKGFGLFAKEDLKAGQFLVEYVGEVLDEEEYIRRKQFYEGSHQRHYYFMNIGNGEVVDATRKGGVGRFINHSCSPNCETQKWVVQGEISIGLFTLKDIPAGTELTFDYNFERYGDKPVKCLCGTPACRGLIGGERETADTVGVQISATEEEEDLEPIMVTENEEDDTLGDILDRIIGLGWEDGWTPSLQAKLEKLARSRGITLPKAEAFENQGPSVDDESFLKAAAKAAFSSLPDSAKRAKSRFSSKIQRSKTDPDWKEPGSTNEKKTSKKKPTFAPSKEIYINNRIFIATSEVQRQVKTMLTQSGRLKNTTKEGVVDFLRLFNLCNLGHTIKGDSKGEGEVVNGDFKGKNGATHLHPEREEARQRARCVDLSFLMDIIIRTDGLTAKHTFVEMGLLRQLLLIMAPRKDNISEQIAVVFRKALRTIEALPFTCDTVRQTRSAHMSFEDLLKDFTSHSDYELKSRAWTLLKKWSLSLPDSQKNARQEFPRPERFGGSSGNYSGAHNTKTPSITKEIYGVQTSQQQYSNTESRRSYEHGNYHNDRSPSISRPYDSRYKREASHYDRHNSAKRSKWDSIKEESPPLPPPAAPEGPEFSPMTDDEMEEGALHEEKDILPKKDDILDHVEHKELIRDPFDDSSNGEKPTIVYVSGKTWSYPDGDFEKFVIQTVRKQLGKYESPKHPMRLQRDEAAGLFSKIRKDIMHGEKEAYLKRKSNGEATGIEQGKSEARMKQFIKEKVHRFLSQRKNETSG